MSKRADLEFTDQQLRWLAETLDYLLESWKDKQSQRIAQELRDKSKKILATRAKG